MRIPRYRPDLASVLFSAGFRPFFLGAAIWAAIGIPLWLLLYDKGVVLPSLLPPLIWHIHEMIFGFGAAAVAGFLLTAIPNWTGRMPLQGWPLTILFALWVLGRIGILLSAWIGARAAAVADLSFPLAFLSLVAREIVGGRSWSNLPMVGAVSLLLVGNLLVHLDVLHIADTANVGNRVGVATLLILITLVGGRIIPSFTRRSLLKNRAAVALPPPEGRFDRAVLGLTMLALFAWLVNPAALWTAWCTVIAGGANGLRMSRWQGHQVARNPLLFVLHVGYGWLAIGLALLGLSRLLDLLPATAALHLLTVGAIGTMTLAVMTRASLGHTDRPLVAGWRTQVIYVLVTLATVLRVLSPLTGAQMLHVLWASGALWSAAFGLFAIFYGRVLTQPCVAAGARPI